MSSSTVDHDAKVVQNDVDLLEDGACLLNAAVGICVFSEVEMRGKKKSQ